MVKQVDAPGVGVQPSRTLVAIPLWNLVRSPLAWVMTSQTPQKPTYTA